jgi:hypothetical protein
MSQFSVMSVEPTVRASFVAMVTTIPVCPAAIGPGVSTETVSAWLTCSTVEFTPSFRPELWMLVAASGAGHKSGYSEPRGVSHSSIEPTKTPRVMEASIGLMVPDVSQSLTAWR